MTAEELAALIARVRAGDEQAAAELVREFGSVIRREARLRLTTPSVRRLVDEDDVCQSVLQDFFVGMALGHFDVRSPRRLRQLLVSMARRKAIDSTRRLLAAKRDMRKLLAAVDLPQRAATSPTASQVLIGQELLEILRQRLSAEEWRMAELRIQGHDWLAIARRLG